MATFLVVHGGWHGGWCWKKMLPFLQRADHTVYSPSLTGLGDRSHLLTRETGLNTHIQDILNILVYEELQQVLLVAHSYSGMVISAVADQAPERIAHMIYIDAFVPQDGQCLFDLLDTTSATFFQEQAMKFGDGWLVPPPPLARYGVTDEADLAWMNPRIGAQPLISFEERVSLTNPAAQAIPRTYISCLVDQRPAFANIGSRVRTDPQWRYAEIATGHDAMVTAPDQLATLLMQCVSIP